MKLIRYISIVFFVFQYNSYATPCDENATLFSIESSKENVTILEVNSAYLETIVLHQPETLQFSLPLSGTESLSLNLFKANLFSDAFQIVNASGKLQSNADVGVPYWGIVNDNEIATFLFLPNQVLGRYMDDTNVYEVQKIKGNSYEVINYNNDEESMQCLTNDDTIAIEDTINVPLDQEVFIQDKPINIYIEVNYEFPELQGARINKLALVTFNFMQSALLFKNEEIILKISEIFVWDTQSPYGGSEKKQDKKNPSMPQFLSSFKKHRKSFNGDLALLFVEFSSYGNGIAATVGGLCSDKITNKMGVVKTYWDYATEYPKHSRGYKMVAHELGHLLGSPHTYNCAWNGNKTSLDNCRGRGKNCKDPNIDYDNRKDSDYVVMSYCETTSDILKGFGVQSGNKVRRYIANATCIAKTDTWDETLTLHHRIESDHYETYNAKYKANTIHAFNAIANDANAYVIAKDAIYLKEGFIAKSGSYVELKITEDDVEVMPDNNTYQTLVKTYSVDNVINDIIEDDTIKSITIIDILGNELKTIPIRSDEDYLDVPMFFNGFYMVKTTYVDGSIAIRKR